MSLLKWRSSHVEQTSSLDAHQAKIDEVRKLIGPYSEKLPNFCTDDSISRFLRARNWNTEKASKMLKEAVKWRLEYKPEAICWEDIVKEAETGNIYRADYCDKYGRPVVVMRPGSQNTSTATAQIKYLVYCMENAIFNLAADQEQMVWLIDFQYWSLGSISIKSSRETSHVLQDYYPERLGLAILCNTPRIFGSFWKVVKPFLEQKTYKKVQFVYSNDTESQKILSDIFDMDKLESAFGGRSPVGFDIDQYAKRMKEDDKKMAALLKSGPSILKTSEPSSESQAEEALSKDSVTPEAEGVNKLEEDALERADKQ